jgi:hypothetical protein
MSVTLNTVASGYNLSVMNENFQKIQATLNNNVLWRNGFTPGETLMTRDLDMNSNDILNAYVNGESLDDLVTEVKDVIALFQALQDLAMQLSKGASRVVGIPSIQVLRLTAAAAPRELVFLQSYHAGINSGEGFFYYDSTDTTSPDDGGMTIVNNLGQRWKRIGVGEIDGAWFGLRGDNVDCGTYFSSAIDYITTKGGILRLPRGSIHLGTTRIAKVFTSTTPQFGIVGYGSKESILRFANIMPPTRPITESWVTEPNLLDFQGTSQTQFIDRPVFRDFGIDYSEQVFKGGADFNSPALTTPWPYSTGVRTLYLYFCLQPVVENIAITNVYGDGIVIYKCMKPIVKSNYLYNCSANNVVTRSATMASDSNGGGIFARSCYGAVIKDNIIWNPRVYLEEYTNPNPGATYPIGSPTNGQLMLGTICGYLGIWCEFAVNAGSGNFTPPLIDWLSSSTDPQQFNLYSNGHEISGNVVYGYVQGIKTEAQNNADIHSNTVLNCFMPIHLSTTSGTVRDNWIDMLFCGDIFCPQNGYEVIRANIVCSIFGSTNNSGNSMYVVSNNKIYSHRYAAFAPDRPYGVFENNHIRMTGVNCRPFTRRTSSACPGVKIEGNTVYFSVPSVPASIDLSALPGLVFKDNMIRNESSTMFTITISNSLNTANLSFVEGNYFQATELIANGFVQVKSNYWDDSTLYTSSMLRMEGQNSMARDNFFRVMSDMPITPIFANGHHQQFSGNHFVIVQGTGSPVISCMISSRSGRHSQVYENNFIQANTVNNFGLVTNDNMYRASFRNNRTDATDPSCTLLRSSSVPRGPVDSKMNQFPGGLLGGGNTSDPNTTGNLDPAFVPYLGFKVEFLRPAAGAAEGIVYTASGWKNYGSISA